MSPVDIYLTCLDQPNPLVSLTSHSSFNRSVPSVSLPWRPRRLTVARRWQSAVAYTAHWCPAETTGPSVSNFLLHSPFQINSLIVQPGADSDRSTEQRAIMRRGPGARAGVAFIATPNCLITDRRRTRAGAVGATGLAAVGGRSAAVKRVSRLSAR